MQRLILFSLFFLHSAILNLTFATKIEESYFVYSNSPTLKNALARDPKLVMDHPSKKGFEIYGPKGLGEYLKSINVRHEDLNKIEGTFKKIQKVSYPTFEQVVARMRSAATKYSKIMKMFSVGKTVKGRDLWVIKISDNVNADEVEPEFKYIGNMHGDEIVGRELLQKLIEDIGESYVAGDREIVKLVNESEMYIMPSMNPDGAENVVRWNGNNIDLNRNFPNPFESMNLRQPVHGWNNQRSRFGSGQGSLPDSGGDSPLALQPETLAVMKFQEERKFSLSANFHGGAVVFNYPWDSKIERHPMNDFLIDISLEYSKLNLPMWNSTEFSQGITNGADWYIVKGGMQDWSYVVHNDLQFTIELSDVKYPNFAEIPKFYNDNKKAMIEFMNTIFQGGGFNWVAKRAQSGFVNVIDPQGKNLGKFPWKNGEFYKILPQGKYKLNILDMQGSLMKAIEVDVGNGQSASIYQI